MDKTIKKLLKQNPELEFLKDKGIVKCKLNGHEMPCRADIIEGFVKGKKFKRLKDTQQTDKLPDHLSTSVLHKGKIFCAVTNCYINCSASNIERHTSGRRYQRALQQFQQGNLKLYKEQVESEDNEGDNKDDQQTVSAESADSSSDEIDDGDEKFDNQDSPTDNHVDKFADDQHQGLIETTASISKQRKRKKLTIKKTGKGKPKKVRFS